MDFWTKICFNAYIYILRPIFKWFLHVVTGHSELERIIQGKSRGYGQIIAVGNYQFAIVIFPLILNFYKILENSLLRSRRSDLKSLSSCPVATVPSAVKIIVKHKYVSDKNLHW